ncbi:MAG: type II toxin-antitoxin system HicB family antitoxin [Nitrospirae bacterium]|nr:type II toxin-antitoxin system HicB family antitoxin [Nitrospirota bacterium]MBF0540190.1 type II toxin-antitoxin system HicB family antitoxin [Nitrospirota bacterium]
MIAIDFDIIVFQEDNTCIAYCPALDVSSCGDTIEDAKKMIKTAVRLFVEESEKMGTLEEILHEANYKKLPSGRWIPPKIVATELVSVA